MDFAFSEQQELLKKEARNFFDAEYPKKLVKELEESEPGYSPEIWKKMADLGWLGLIVPEDYGGVGGDLLDLAILFEEVGKTACPAPLFSTLVFGVLPLLEGGSENQKKELLSKVADGDAILTMAINEPETDYKPEFITTRAVKDGDGFVINGTKLFVPYAHVADYILVVAATSEVSADGKGITVFLVKKGAEGVGFVPLVTVGADKQSEVTLKDVRVSADDIVGKVDEGWALVESTIRKATALQCVETVGVMQQALAMTADYTSNRIQFGRPIGSFQAVQHRLADMLTDVEGSRWTSYRAVSLMNKGQHAGREVAIAKAWTGDACQRVAYAAQHLHGGIGMDLDYDLHYYFQWAKSRELNLGASWNHLASIEPVVRG
ncbi:MAG: acyl-CoA/acyl-ACP dehydrogenase [Chloroflexi bacterium]|jgi:3-oxocholest-4-en-26-oyl-CoA dehydrogenase beta subunit|nr:acyl-CoA/acyl-ACP dehydrogenase [Chloroflexota bacterium]